MRLLRDRGSSCCCWCFEVNATAVLLLDERCFKMIVSTRERERSACLMRIGALSMVGGAPLPAVLPPEASTAQRAAKEANPSSNPLLRAGRLAGLLRAGADERVWASGSLHRWVRRLSVGGVFLRWETWWCRRRCSSSFGSVLRSALCGGQRGEVTDTPAAERGRRGSGAAQGRRRRRCRELGDQDRSAVAIRVTQMTQVVWH